MKVLITGGSGFVARNLYESIKNEHEVSCFSRKELDLLDADKVYQCLKKNRFEVVVHTATYDAVAKFSTKDPTKVLECNLRMYFNLLRGRAYFSKMIYFGSGAEFNRQDWIAGMGEDYYDCHVPNDQYGFSKYLMTKNALSEEKIYNLRLFGMFGKYDDWRTRLIPNVCYLAIMGMKVTIEQNKYYDFLDIADLVRIIKWFFINNPKEKVFNVCTGRVTDYKTIAEKIIKISGKKLDLVIKNEGLGKEYSGDNSLLMKQLGDFKFCDFDKSLKTLYDWYDKNKNDIFIDKKR